jgi:hypothetical protein
VMKHRAPFPRPLATDVTWPERRKEHFSRPFFVKPSQ